jgi:3-deoxy-manno-octulosonate cytidylyltransferase (CMP-KDO synthetase)
MKSNKIIIVIPARYGSSRFPGKPLALINGKTMIRRVYEQCTKSKLAGNVFVATDDLRIADEVNSFNGNVIMTSKDCKNGTERIYEATKNMDVDIIVNMQGDEPLINPLSIDKTIQVLLDDSEAVVSNAILKSLNINELIDYNNVKAMVKSDFKIIFYSRFPISKYIQVGLYAFKKDYLELFAEMRERECERFENIELMRVIANNGKINGVVIDDELQSVDVPSHISKVERILNTYKIVDPFKELYKSDRYRNADKRCITFPLIVDVEPTNNCFLSCVFCNRQVMKRECGFMSFDCFKLIADEVAMHEDSVIRFSGWGEPLLNKDLPRFIAYASDKGILTHLNTNGFKLNIKLIEKLLFAGVDKIKISFQGATEEQYEKMRNNKDYDSLEENIRLLVKVRNKLKANTFIQVSTSITDESKEEINMFVNKWSNIVDGVFGVGGEKDYLTSFARVNKPDGVKNTRVRIKGTRCMEILTKLSVSWNGNVKACCSDYDDFLLLGNINNHSLKDCWNGDKRLRLKRGIASGCVENLPLFCRGCDTLF